MEQNGMYAVKHFCYITKYDCHWEKALKWLVELPDELMANIMLFRLGYLAMCLKNEQSEHNNLRKAIGSIFAKDNASFQGQIRISKNSYLPPLNLTASQY